MPGVFNDQALFDAKVVELEEQRLNLKPEAAIEEAAPEPAPESDGCPDFSYNTSRSRSGSCTREELTKECLRCDQFPVHDLDDPGADVNVGRCYMFIENYGGYNHGSCSEADKPYCPNCSNYPREKWIFTRFPSSWTESEALQFLLSWHSLTHPIATKSTSTTVTLY